MDSVEPAASWETETDGAAPPEERSGPVEQEESSRSIAARKMSQGVS